MRRGWVIETSFQPAGSRGPSAGPRLKAVHLAQAASANHTSSPSLAVGLVQLSALLRPGPSFGPRRDLPEPCLPRPAGRRASAEVRSRDSPQQTAQILPVTPLTGADYDFEVRRRQKETPWGWGGGGGEQSLSNLFAHNCLFLSRKSLKQTCRENSAPPAWSRGETLLPGARRAAKSDQEFLWPDCLVGRERAPPARGAPETLQEATPRTSLRLARVPRPGSPGHLLPST